MILPSLAKFLHELISLGPWCEAAFLHFGVMVQMSLCKPPRAEFHFSSPSQMLIENLFHFECGELTLIIEQRNKIYQENMCVCVCACVSPCVVGGLSEGLILFMFVLLRKINPRVMLLLSVLMWLAFWKVKSLLLLCKIFITI
jgi:hypothetical protein